MNHLFVRRVPTVLRRLTFRSSLRFNSTVRADPNVLRLTKQRAIRPLLLRASYATAEDKPKATKKKTTTSKKAKAKSGAAATKKKTKKKTTKKRSTAKRSRASTAEKKLRKKPTQKQKEALQRKKLRDEIKELKSTALSPPKPLPHSTFGIILQREERGTIAEKTEVYKSLTTRELEDLQETAKGNANANRIAFDQWVSSHTPLQIKQANYARRRLRVLLKKNINRIRDPRQLKRPRTAYIIYATEHLHDVGLANLPVKDRVAKIGESWRNLSKMEQEKYHRMQEEAERKYAADYESTYGEKPPARRTKAKAKAETPSSSE